ncbi:MAG: LytR C-terminal domain-containing protein [Deltaproteobacteria bacterium]|nr:LytR C-terminal domain-containing protein [Deltaproteobacteria bacterium]
MVVFWGFLALGGPLSAQNGTQVVDGLSLTSEDTTLQLVINGTFDPAHTPGVKIAPLPEELGEVSGFQVVIPGARPGGSLGAAYELPMGEDTYRVQVQAEGSDGGEETIRLMVETPKNFGGRVLPNASGPNELRVRVFTRPPAPESEAPESAANSQPQGEGGTPSSPEPEPPVVEETVPDAVLFPPSRVRVTIVNRSGQTDLGHQMAWLLVNFHKKPLEKSLGVELELVNVSTLEGEKAKMSVVQYKPGFLKAALLIAKNLPGEQFVAPMKPEGLNRSGFDVEIVLGMNPR